MFCALLGEVAATGGLV